MFSWFPKTEKTNMSLARSANETLCNTYLCCPGHKAYAIFTRVYCAVLYAIIIAVNVCDYLCDVYVVSFDS